MSRPTASDPRQEHFRLLHRLLSHRPFRRMLAREGIDLRGTWWRGSEEMIFRALGRCAACSSTAICRAWLDREHPPGTFPSFCPNGSVLEACRILDPAARPLLAEETVDAVRREPSLAEIVEEPIVKQLMESDRVGVIATLRMVLNRR